MTLPAPITLLSPIVTPGIIRAPRAYPAVFADTHRHVELIRLFAQLGPNRMPRGRDGDIRAYHRVRADVDMRVANGGEVEVCVYRVAEMDVRPPQFAWNGGSR